MTAARGGGGAPDRGDVVVTRPSCSAAGANGGDHPGGGGCSCGEINNAGGLFVTTTSSCGRWMTNRTAMSPGLAPRGLPGHRQQQACSASSAHRNSQTGAAMGVLQGSAPSWCGGGDRLSGESPDRTQTRELFPSTPTIAIRPRSAPTRRQAERAASPSPSPAAATRKYGQLAARWSMILRQGRAGAAQIEVEEARAR